ncbi:PREDICTED: uncharacterized protein LOC109151227 [Ipomoea nil]|uniref:uncharacterized protein LOC109151227 n=1 Tax=Ipomoea nil TaxID=35883 RepID=UPI000901FF31|nr:PREDICTED: uncharacterized protein LOC109151227 [Ipomoea nil]
MCGVEHENLVHSLITCGYTMNIWARSNIPIPNSATNIFSDWFNDLLNILDDDGIIYAVALLYFIWRTRNGAVWEAKLPRPQNVIAMALSSVNAWKEAHPARRSPQAITTMPAAILPPVAAVYCPREGAAIMGEGEAETLPLSREFSATVQHNTTHNGRNQCYFDATYDPTTNKAAMGAIILDSRGCYVSAMTTPIMHCFSPLMAEAFACKEALSWLRHREETDIDLYTDCLVLQQYLSSTTHSLRSYLGYAIDSCKTSMASFDYCLIHYVPRLDNYLAHTLASSATNHLSSMYADLDPPDSISAYFE